MRRIKQSETLHGTRDGQLAIDHELADRHGFTERESVCATLLKSGYSSQDIAARLEISPSTAEKHLLGLRRKLGVNTTREAVVALLRAQNDTTARISETFGLVLPFSSAEGEPLGSELANELRDLETLEAMLDRLQADLDEDGVGALFYFFLPLSAASFRKGDAIVRSSASKTIMAALEEDAGASQLRIAARLFEEPDRPVVVRLDRGEAGLVSPIVSEACLGASLRRWITVGSPFGTGYVVLSAICRRSGAAAAAANETETVELIRRRLLLMQNIAYSFGALARTAGLSVRERNALAAIAAGSSTRAAAAVSETSERAFGQTLKSAREKLGADTTAEAIAKAMALNALVFL